MWMYHNIGAIQYCRISVLPANTIQVTVVILPGVKYDYQVLP